MSCKIVTHSGRVFDLLNPRPEDVSVVDIAHALSMICRFGGHTEQFYSVAQHSVLVSLFCDPAEALDGLLHDAAEAYVGDMVGPLKHAGDELAGYRRVEAGVQAAVAAHFGTRPAATPSVRQADARVFASEMRDVVPGTPAKLELPEHLRVDPAPVRIFPLDQRAAKLQFLRRFVQLIVERQGGL